MGNIIQDVIPFGGMNTDDDFHLFPEGDYRYAENVRNATSEEGNIGAFENILGNEVISNGELWNIRTLENSIVVPNTAIHTCIGSCIDITTNCVYYAVHTSPFIKTISQVDCEYVQDAIYEYNKETGILTTLLKDGHETIADATVFYEKFLNFSLLHPMNGMYVVDGKLYFNDGYNPPRKINIDRAKNFTKSINTRISFSDNYFAGGNVGFVVSQAYYDTLAIGDRIQIFQDRGATYSYYDGTTIITNKIIDGTNHVIVTDKGFMGATTIQGGYLYKSYGGYSIPFKEVFMDRIKYPPTYAPESIYSDDLNYEFNNLTSAQFQFAYKYIYDDKEESTLSPISKISTYTTTLSSSVFVTGDNIKNNVIKITLNTGENNVKGIKIYARSTSKTSGDNPVTVNCNNSDWWLIDELTKYDDKNALIIDDNIEKTYSFYNSQNKQYGDQADLNRPFDYVPQICATSEIVENSRIVDGNITEGYDNTDLDIDLDFLATNIIDDSEDVWEDTSYTASDLYDGRYVSVYFRSLVLPIKTSFEVGQKIVFQITPIPTSGFQPESIVIDITQSIYDNYPLSVKDIIRNMFIDKHLLKWGFYVWGDSPHQYSYLFSGIFIRDDSVNNTVILHEQDAKFLDSTHRQLESQGNRHMNYFFNPIQSGDSAVNIYYKTKIASFSGTYNDHEILFIQYGSSLDDTAHGTNAILPWLFTKLSVKLLGGENTINSTISCKQNDYHEFGIVYSDRAGRTSFVNKTDSLKKYLGTYLRQNLPDNKYYFIPKFTIKNLPPTWATNYEFVYNPYGVKEYYLQYYTQSISYDTPSLMTKINIGALISQVNTLYSQTIIEPYIWQRGDRISIITQKDGTTLLTTKQDHEIVKADATYIWVQPDLTGVVGISGVTPASNEGWLYEIYRPAKTNKESVYFSVGEKYPITNGYHIGGEQNQTSSQPAIVSIQTGNCYVKRGYYLTVDGYREDVNAYDFFKSDGIDIGRPNIANVNAKQQHLFNHIRFSGKLFQNTQINNLCRNDASDYIQVSSKFGAITKLVEIGYVLKVLQEKNLNSVYLSRTQLTNTDGSTNLSAVNTPLGTINPSESLYGSKYPRSVIRNNRSLYFLDTMQGAFIKDDNNGSEQISETRKMNRFFTDLCRKIESGLYTVVMTGSYDIRHEEAILSVSLTLIASPYTVTYHTIAYSEIKNKFTTFYTYNTEQLENIGQQLISLKNGELYLHNKTTNYNEFYGVDYPQKITIVGNKNPKFNKIFTNTAIRTNGEWNVPEIRILPTLNYPIGMKSRLKKNKFVNKEGVQYASFMNDMTDPRYATPSEALINGRPLRGECMEIDYENDSTDRCVTLMFTIGMTNSELTI